MAKTYLITVPGDEDAWNRAGAEHHAAVYAVHEEFVKELRARGHTKTGGLELAHSRDAKVMRRSAGGGVTVTDGPYAETAEQLTGFYTIETDDLADLLDVCRILLREELAIEIRASA